MLFEDTKILELNQHQKSDKVQFVIYERKRTYSIKIFSVYNTFI